MHDPDPVQLEIFRNLFASIAEEMGTVLRRTSYSPNIKERQDYSCAVFDSEGKVIAMGDHMPVHLGSMPLSVQAAIEDLDIDPGDVVLLNDPYSGGTHLPDITAIAPVFSGEQSSPSFFVASRAHHSDVGGSTPGSMPLSADIFQEGIRIPPVKLYGRGRLNRDLLRVLLTNVRTPTEREGDLAAQVGALKVGEKRLLELHDRYGGKFLQSYVEGLHDYAERTVRRVIEKIGDGRYQAEEYLDDNGIDTSQNSKPVSIKVAIEISGDDMRVDFSGSDRQVAGCMNAVYAITVSAVFYVLRCLSPRDVPMSAGLMRPVEVIAPEGTVVNAVFPAAIAAGNVETSQRIVDVLLRALSGALPGQIPAASSGTMNNLTIGGFDPPTGLPFTYYETVGGGMGASPNIPGDSGIHTHMTNSLNTPIEALESAFPLRVREYRIRWGTGGKGRNDGGNGIVRQIEVLTDCQVTILSERRKYAPYGLSGGASGKKGANYLQEKQGRRRRLRGKDSLNLSEGDSIIIETPGGGGWGKRR